MGVVSGRNLLQLVACERDDGSEALCVPLCVCVRPEFVPWINGERAERLRQLIALLEARWQHILTHAPTRQHHQAHAPLPKLIKGAFLHSSPRSSPSSSSSSLSDDPFLFTYHWEATKPQHEMLVQEQAAADVEQAVEEDVGRRYRHVRTCNQTLVVHVVPSTAPLSKLPKADTATFLDAYGFSKSALPP